jgi:hypothetical protein
MLIQLYANVLHGANLPMDGKRGSLFGTDNKTNLYIYRLEIENRQGVIDHRENKNHLPNLPELLNIPNLNRILGTVGDIERQEEVFRSFLEFFLNNVRMKGMTLENQIGAENLSALLNFFILAERYKGTADEERYWNLRKTLQENIKNGVLDNIKENEWLKAEQSFAKINEHQPESLSPAEKEEVKGHFKEILSYLEKNNDTELRKWVLISLANFFTREEV